MEPAPELVRLEVLRPVPSQTRSALNQTFFLKDFVVSLEVEQKRQAFTGRYL